MFGFLSLGGKSVVRETQKCKQDDLIEFLKEIRTANYSIDIIIILDNASLHKAKRVKEFCRQNQIYLLYLPPYSPNLNPIEFCWKDVKKFLSQFYRESIDLLKIKGKAISEEFLTLRQDSYTRKWQKKFL